jgi:uncharacterized SAM-binding protein YcdF (DUF218 family)
MILLSGIVSVVFLSPLVFCLLLAGGTVLLILKKRTAALSLIGATTVLLLLLSLPVVSSLALRPLERKWPPFPAHPPVVHAIVVLGGGVRQGVADETGSESLTGESRARVVYGAILYRRLGVPVIMSGGTIWAERFARSEAEVAAAELILLGVPEADVIREDRSRTTRENAAEVAKILVGRGMSRIALVTSAAHMPRALLAFSRAGISCVPGPTNYLSRTVAPAGVDFLPSFDALQECFFAFREYCGMVLYTLRR